MSEKVDFSGCRCSVIKEQ